MGRARTRIRRGSGRITRPASWQQDEGIVQPVPKGADRLSRRLHQLNGHPCGGRLLFRRRCVDSRHGSRHQDQPSDVGAGRLFGRLDRRRRNDHAHAHAQARKPATCCEHQQQRRHGRLNTGLWNGWNRNCLFGRASMPRNCFGKIGSPVCARLRIDRLENGN